MLRNQNQSRINTVEQPTLEDFLVIPHPSGDRVLLVPGRRWSLPRLTNAIGVLWPTEPVWDGVARVERAMWAQFRLDGPVLRCLHVGSGRWPQFVYEVTPPPTTWTPPEGAHWVGHDEVRRMHLDMPEHHALLDQWFIEANDAAALARRPPWYRPGWNDDAYPWIKEQLTRLGLTAIAPPEKLRHRERSCELRIRTSGGRVHFKAVPPVFAHEGPVVDMLSRLFPGEVPKVLAYDDGRRWMLLDAGETSMSLAQHPDEARCADALRRYAEMQRASEPHVAALDERGCPVRPVQELPAKLDALLSDTAVLDSPQLAPGETGTLAPPLSWGEIGHLRALVPDLIAACDELGQATFIPQTVVEHGNVWPHYITPTQNSYLFSDWQDVSLTHPFFSLTPFLMSASEMFDDPAIEDRLRDAYLEPWADVAPRADLLRLFELGRRLSPLHYATMYHRNILPSMSAPWERTWLVRESLRILLILWDVMETTPPDRVPSKAKKTRLPSRPNQLPRSQRT